jgi:TolA-binding protein
VSPDCAPRDSYLDGSLAADARAKFETHASGCTECTAVLASWEKSKGALASWAKSFDRAPTSNEVAQLIEKADAPKASWLPRSFALVAVGAAALVAFLMLGPSPVKTVELSGAMAKADVDGDHVAIDEGSKATVRELAPGQTRVRLESGSVVSKVLKRKPGGYFIVETGDTEVRVVGTLFEVQKTASGVAVRVREGRVEVWRGTSKLQVLSAGEAWADGESVSHPLADGEARSMLELLGEPLPAVAVKEAPAPAVTAELEAAARDAGEGLVEGAADEVKTAPDRKLETWTRGCNARGASATSAQQEMEAYLKGAPRDSDVWQLLGLCRKGSGNNKGAVDAYKRAIAVGSAMESNQARLGMADVLEKLRDFKGVKEQMEHYLKAPAAARAGEAEASALIKLAHAQMNLGENDAAKATFESLIKKHPRSPLAAKAQSELQGL